MNSIPTIIRAPQSGHWVGDGFPVRGIFAEYTFMQAISPFLMLDYAEPFHFEAAKQPRGVGPHPHRGFETVTIAYQGAITHRDSLGSQDTIQAGDVQWMTAGSGILHEEMHAQSFTQQGGTFEMIQLWVNLPSSVKTTPPRYQAILNKDIPIVTLPSEQGTLRVIAGHFDGTMGAAKTFTPINVWDGHVNAYQTIVLPVAAQHNTLLFVRRGSLKINETTVNRTEVALLSSTDSSVLIETQEAADFVLLSGIPINEPIVTHGPFVMNTDQEIQQAISDYRSGAMGTMS